MPDGASQKVSIRLVDSISTIDAAAWDACAMGATGDGNPFLRHAFLKALEDSKSVGGRSGWGPQHMVCEGEDGRLLGAVPLYVKGHSQGEYVFDHGWAQALERAGGAYYPKLLAAVPFTPVPGARLLTAPGDDAPSVADAMARAMAKIAADNDISSVHVNFCTAEEQALLAGAGYLRREGVQYHWSNAGYATFDDFLGALASRKRKAIRKERESVRKSGIRLRALTGAEIEPRHWDAFFAFYMDTGGRKWGRPYLTRAFFDILGATMADSVVLMMAENADGDPVGGALNLQGDDCLYGRNWGCLENHAFLHFEACYYMAIDWAIAHGLKRVEAGAQGEHKIQRGYLPVATHSAHWIGHKGLRDAVSRFLVEEREGVAREIQGLMAYSPFRKDGEKSDNLD